MKKKILVILFFVFIFFTFNGIVYFITELDKKDRIKKALDSHISRLKTHYEIIIHDQELNADSVYKTTIDKKHVIDILTKALKATKEQKAVLREQLLNYLLHKYEIMKDRGVLQYHFISPENICFLRMHKFNKFDDNLSDTRADIKYVNLHKTIIRGFEQGRTSHGFRNVYPVYGKNNDLMKNLGV
ncbi:MAG: hypothetical protein U9O56_07445 [Campylobacterota bacterium]|nr:hypothetical protein [Campylobacterota bacterium]